MRLAQYLAGATCTLLAPTLPRAAERAGVPLRSFSDPFAVRPLYKAKIRYIDATEPISPRQRAIHHRQYMP